MEKNANIAGCGHQKVCNNICSSNLHLRKVLNAMFPSSYIKLYHQPPNAVCSLLNITCWPTKESSSLSTYSRNQNFNLKYRNQQDYTCLLEPSTEPSSRSNIISLQKHFDETLIDHQAKSVGLCPIRRCIYDQCFGRFCLLFIPNLLIRFQIISDKKKVVSFSKRLILTLQVLCAPPI